MLNQCNFIGRAARDFELKYLESGAAVASGSIAVSEKFKNKAGEMVEKTEWIRLKFWAKLAEIVGQYVKKGTLIYVSGKMETREWEKEGVKQYSTEINCREMRLLGSKSDSQGQQSGPSAHNQQKQNGYQPQGSDDDSIPF